jgi:hypothetical protein
MHNIPSGRSRVFVKVLFFCYQNINAAEHVQSTTPALATPANERSLKINTSCKENNNNDKISFNHIKTAGQVLLERLQRLRSPEYK